VPFGLATACRWNAAFAIALVMVWLLFSKRVKQAFTIGALSVFVYAATWLPTIGFHPVSFVDANLYIFSFHHHAGVAFASRLCHDTEKNPITLVRQSAKRLRTPDVLDVEEIRALLAQLEDPFKTMVFVATTGLRVSELLGMKWQDIGFDVLEIHLSRAIVDGVLGDMNTEASRKPVPLDSALADVLLNWRGRAPYHRDEDWVFGSPEKLGQQPYWPDSALRKAVRPAAVGAGITKHIGWHTFRHYSEFQTITE